MGIEEALSHAKDSRLYEKVEVTATEYTLTRTEYVAERIQGSIDYSSLGDAATEKDMPAYIMRLRELARYKHDDDDLFICKSIQENPKGVCTYDVFVFVPEGSLDRQRDAREAFNRLAEQAMESF